MRGTWGDGWAENKYRSLFQTMELTRDFYFSYTYDLTNTLQELVLGLGLGLGLGLVRVTSRTRTT